MLVFSFLQNPSSMCSMLRRLVKLTKSENCIPLKSCDKVMQKHQNIFLFKVSNISIPPRTSYECVRRVSMH